MSILTPGWCLAVGAVVAAVLGFGDGLDRRAGRGHDRWVIGRSERPIHTIAFTPDDTQVATLEANGRLTFWQAEGGGSWTSIGGDGLNVRCFAFDPQGNTVALGCLDGSIRLRDWRTGRDSGRIEASDVSIQALAFSPDGLRLASGESNGHLTLWEAETGRRLLDVNAHRGSVTALAFSPEGRWLTSAGFEGRLTVRDAVTGALLASTSSRSRITSARIAPARLLSPSGRSVGSPGKASRERRWQQAISAWMVR